MNLRRMSIPKVGVLVMGLTAGVLVATINPVPAQATPRAASCVSCHNMAPLRRHSVAGPRRFSPTRRP